MNTLFSDFERLGVRPGDIILMHSSMKSLQTDMKPEEFLLTLCNYLGPRGTLVLPTLSYSTVTRENNVFHAKETPACIGLLPNVFRKLEGSVRSIHPTHSCAARGYLARELTEMHILDDTPVGPNSPFRLLADNGGKILMLGPVNASNTFMHGMEEIAGVPYCLTPEKHPFLLIDADGNEHRKSYYLHNLRQFVARQCYFRVEALLPRDAISRGNILAAPSTLMDAATLRQIAVPKMKEETWYFVDRK